jgi:aspartyl-tRNA(Asn)/glutamyl-tRNA(Gln) amidotransferase subunit B
MRLSWHYVQQSPWIARSRKQAFSPGRTISTLTYLKDTKSPNMNIPSPKMGNYLSTQVRVLNISVFTEHTWKHLEEDTGKLTHVVQDEKSYSLVDLNRAGVPLLEIVSEPDMHSVEEATAYSRELRLLLRIIDVSSGDMEKGIMRFEANISIRPEDCKDLGTRVEVKNLNSFKAMENAIIYQIGIQKAALEKGKKVRQQTLGWDEKTGKTFSQRSKENANDYRYFPEPDLPPLIVDKAWVADISAAMPELPNAKRARYAADHKLQKEDIERLIEEKETSDFFETCVHAAPSLTPKSIVNWMLTDLFAWIKQSGTPLKKINTTPADFTDLIALVEKGVINQTTGKEVLVEMLESGKSAELIVKGKGLQQVSDSGLINDMVETVLNNNPDEVQAYLKGKDTIANWLFGQVMQEAKGKANPQIVKIILQEQLNSRKL